MGSIVPVTRENIFLFHTQSHQKKSCSMAVTPKKTEAAIRFNFLSANKMMVRIV
jgi:hypothetical protein